MRPDVNPRVHIRTVEREVHLDRVAVDLEVNVVDPGQVTGRGVGDIGCAADDRRSFGRRSDDELRRVRVRGHGVGHVRLDLRLRQRSAINAHFVDAALKTRRTDCCRRSTAGSQTG